MWKKKRYWKWAALSLIGLLLFILEEALPQIFSVPVNLLLPFVLVTAIYEGPVVGASYGIYCGILSDIFSSPFGYTALIYLILGCAAGLVMIYLRQSVTVAFLFTLVGGLVYFSLTWFLFYYFWYKEGLLYFRIVPLQILYSAIITVILYPLSGFVKKRLDKAD